ncbi:M60 family metallopeptidase [Streptomyces sp. NPDC051322]|uniref:M60 family metallopeptidase n=1 Tax=Streptomyces sp. NPDC051322 TaxID=3154645 RepID=UPI00344FE9E5
MPCSPGWPAPAPSASWAAPPHRPQPPGAPVPLSRSPHAPPGRPRIGLWDYYGEITEPRSYALKPGANTVTDPHGGPVYLTLEGSGQRAAVKFRAGAVPMPVFALGRTSEASYQEQLDALTDVPYVELHAEHTIMTLTREGALLYRDEDHAALLQLVETIIDSHARISGLDGSRPVHRRKAGVFHFTEVSKVPSGVGAYATHGYNGFPRAYLDRATTVEGLRTRGWGLYHELGHLHQQFAYKPAGLTEVTVNIYSLAAQRTLGQPSNLLTVDAGTGKNYFQSAAPKLGALGTSYEKTFSAYEKLVPLRQLELAFGDSFWPQLHRLVREENPQSAAGETARRYRALATYSSRVAGYDLTDFFVKKWAFPIDATGLAELAALQLPEPPVDPSTLADAPAPVS